MKNKKTPYIRDTRLEERVKSLRINFGNKDHIRISLLWGDLSPLYARETKGKIVLSKITDLENQLETLLTKVGV